MAAATVPDAVFLPGLDAGASLIVAGLADNMWDVRLQADGVFSKAILSKIS